MNNNFPSRETVEHIRKQYPVGCRVELLRMDDPQAPPIGTKGTVRYVDDIGSLGVAWDNGSSLQVVYGEDLCRKLEETMWKEGSLKIHDSVFHYWMKQYSEGSQFGIEGGRISKLILKRNGAIVCNYDRGWDVEPSDPDTQLALELLLHNENH